MEIKDLFHPNTEQPASWMNMGFLISREPGHVTGDVYFWDAYECEFYGTIIHHIPLDKIYGWVYIGELEDALFKKIEDGVIKEVHGFKVGDKVRLTDGDGRIHIIKEFVEEEGLHSLNFYCVDFEDNTANGLIFPGRLHRTNMVKIDE